jgi:1A family penicillin-binding protein
VNSTAARLNALRRRRNRKNNGSGLRRVLLAIPVAIAILAISGALAGAGAAVGVYAYYAKDLPAPEEVGRQSTQESFKTTKIYDRSGKTVLYEIYDPQGGNRTLVPLAQIPRHLINATIALEDKDFYTNPGFDWRGIMRAFINNLQGLPIQGSSTITMQLVRNVTMTPEERLERSYQRKIKEAILSWELSRRYPGQQGKDQILEWYLNTVFYGNQAYGVEAAAETYFGKHVQDLDLAECAMLVAIPQYPALNPFDNPERAKERQAIVLDQMYLQDYITAEQAYAAKQEKLRYSARRFDITAPHFAMYVRRLLEEKYGPDVVYRGGLKVYTTIDLDLQKTAEEIARQHIAKLEQENRHVSNAALVAIDPRTGEIKAMLGSIDYFNRDIDGQVNVALAERQPGSSFKVFTYLTAFAQGYTPATMVMDVPSTFPDDPNPPYSPENYDRKYHGPQLLRSALANSFNVPAVKVLSMVGVKNVVATAHRMGINTLNRDYYGLSLTLGGGEVRLLDMTYAYGVLANSGVMAGQPVPPDQQRPGYRDLDPVAILRIEDAEGKVIEQYTSPQTKEVVDPKLAYLLTDILSDNVARMPMYGPSSVLKLSRPAAVKTGTTSDWRDNWTIGYTPQLVTGVWVGNSDNSPMEHIGGVTGAGPIWHDFMEKALASLPVEKFIEPPGMMHVEVCAKSGLLPTPQCPNKRSEIFIQGTEPTAYDNVYQVFRICKPSGKLATVYCPPDQVEEKVFEVYPSEAADWVRDNNIPQPPTEYDDTYGPSPVSADVSITSPKRYAYVRGVVPVNGNVRIGNLQVWRLEYGQGLDPASWIQIGGDHHGTVSSGLLDNWDVSVLDGLYTLQVTAIDNGGSYHQFSVQVTVDNDPPQIKIIHPLDKATYVMEQDEWVNIQTQTTDNYSMDRVEFYMDDQLIATSTVAPFGYKWTIKMQAPLVPGVPSEPEKHTIYAVAYDAAGNRTESARIEIEVKHKEGTPTPAPP